MTQFDGLDELRASCPPGSTLRGPIGADGTSFTFNGRSTAACVRSDGKRHGPVMEWYQGGSRAASGNYREDLKDGPWIYWHESRQVSGRGSFKAGKPEGLWTTWHDNGQKESEGSYVDGLQQGPFTHWDRSGRIAQMLHYDQGKLIRTILYRNGQPIE